MKVNRSTMPMIIIFLLPAILLYIFFFLIPGVRALYVSLFDWNGFTTSREFIGLDNFRELFTNQHFWKYAMKNTLFIALFGGIGIFTVAFSLAGILTTDIPAQNLIKNIIFFPSILNPVAIAILWNYIYDPNNGLINGILSFFGVINLPVWTSQGRLFWAVLVAMVWMYSGYYFIIIYSALKRLPTDFIEAGRLEGCNELSLFFRIKLPLVMDIVPIMITFWLLAAIKEFTLFYAWGGGVDVPKPDLQNIATYMQFIAFGKRIAVYRLGYATSMGVIMFILTILSILIVQRIFRKNSVLEY